MPQQRNSRWDNNETQFARLLCEIVATSPVGQNPDIHALAESMDLTPSDVRELFDRAEQVWEKVLAPDHGFNSERSKQSENGGRP